MLLAKIARVRVATSYALYQTTLDLIRMAPPRVEEEWISAIRGGDLASVKLWIEKDPRMLRSVAPFLTATSGQWPNIPRSIGLYTTVSIIRFIF